MYNNNNNNNHALIQWGGDSTRPIFETPYERPHRTKLGKLRSNMSNMGWN